MVNENPIESRLSEENKKLKIDPETFKEIKLLYGLGIEIYELEYLFHMKIKEEMILKEI